MARSSRRRAISVGLLLVALGGRVSGAVLSGTVVESRSGRLLARAQVVLDPRQNLQITETQRILTDSSGQFAFTGVSGGMYLLRVEKSGYAKAEYGQRSHGEPGTPILLEDEASFRALVNLQKLGAITGEVVDENGVGLPGVTVNAYRASGRPRQVAAARTDDRGVYRLAGLAPDSYLVRTAAKRLEDGLDLMPTYYPGAASATEASRLEVALDTEASGVTIAPLTGDLAEVTGTFGATGTLMLVSEFSLRVENTRLGVPFRFESVEPGQYSVVAVSANNANAGYQEIAVGSEDMVVNLELASMPELRLLCEAPSGAQADVESVSFYFRRSEIDDDNPYRLSCGQSADFPPGHWQVAAIPPAHQYVAAILDAGTGAGIHELLLQPGESRELRIALGASPATLSGEVRTREGDLAIGAPVFLRAVTPDLQRRIGGVRQTRTAADGVYRIPGLPPGRYEVLSSYQVRDPEADSWPAGLAATAELDEGDQTTMDLELTTIR